MSPRAGFTLVETLVALVLFQFVMLALGALAATAARDLATVRRMETAHAIARNRVEQLGAATCPPPGGASGEAVTGVVEHWRVQADGPQRLISDSVVYSRANGARGFVIARATVLCTP